MGDQVPRRALQLRSLVTAAQAVQLSLEDVEVPVPETGQVVVRVEAAPINPSDLGLLFAGADMTQATAGGTAARPLVTAPLPPAAARSAATRVGQSLPVGNEGAGTVVAVGASGAAQALLGKVVPAGPCTRTTAASTRPRAWNCRTGPGRLTGRRRSSTRLPR